MPSLAGGRAERETNYANQSHVRFARLTEAAVERRACGNGHWLVHVRLGPGLCRRSGRIAFRPRQPLGGRRRKADSCRGQGRKGRRRRLSLGDGRQSRSQRARARGRQEAGASAVARLRRDRQPQGVPAGRRQEGPAAGQAQACPQGAGRSCFRQGVGEQECLRQGPRAL